MMAAAQPRDQSLRLDQAKGKYIRLRSTSCQSLFSSSLLPTISLLQDQRLGGWKLKSQINNKEPVSFTFDPSFILEAGQTVTMWVPGYGTHNPPTDLEWRGLKSWSIKDHLQIDLFSSDQGTYKCESKKKANSDLY
ncbi:hypothetical protein L3Q82_016530 [Scortum barcoo]|uniref:Uncharacterized protein n=1 Tax=Scortum barcoo TaxID=214431 RepID=A0ACB8X786_9TELE|nr:hypothetical protein L3Q82_016530 [Scortum barcoo]